MSETLPTHRLRIKSRVMDELYERVKSGYTNRRLAPDRPHIMIVTPNDLPEFLPFVERLHADLGIREALRIIDARDSSDSEHLRDPNPDAFVVLYAERLDEWMQKRRVVQHKNGHVSIPPFEIYATSVNTTTPIMLNGKKPARPIWTEDFARLNERRTFVWPRMADRKEDWAELFRAAFDMKGRELKFRAKMNNDVPRMYAMKSAKRPPAHVGSIIRLADRCLRLMRENGTALLTSRLLDTALYPHAQQVRISGTMPSQRPAANPAPVTTAERESA